MNMKNSSPVKYNTFIHSYDEFDKKEGYCVIDNFLSEYSPHIKKLNK